MKREERESKGKSLEERVADLEAWRAECDAQDEPQDEEKGEE